MLERKFQAKLIKELKDRFPGCIILKNDANYKQGIPDLSVFYQDKWAWLETKQSRNASERPLQDYYVKTGDAMSFARFINPENKQEVLDELQQAFQPRRKTRVPRSVKVPLD